MKTTIHFILLFFSGYAVNAQDSHQLWFQHKANASVHIICARQSPTLTIARRELKNGWQGKADVSVRFALVKDKSLKEDGFLITGNKIQANTDLGILYGTYALLRLQRTGEKMMGEPDNPSYQRRILNHWDNLDGTIERGYAGHSIFWRKKDPFTVSERDKQLWQEYARADAFTGINGAVLNNVNASPLILTGKYLSRVKAIADVLRPYGVKVYLSVNFASPKLIGGLPTADPLDTAVIRWWKTKVKAIYHLVPDFGGFLVKASSEGQPGPQDYGRTHADGANTLADVLRPYGGIVMWRAFVYSTSSQDRTKQAYTEFKPLDGKFKDNVLLQVKNGPLDFQPREPFSALFGAMKHTAVMPEFQITQEYLGHSIYLVFLATMWEECLKSDTYQQGTGSTIARCTDGSIYPQKLTAIAGVSNVGMDANWCGHLFAQANWYAYGRLAWKNTLTSSAIADEWLRLTFNNDNNDAADWTKNFLIPVKQMMLDSREAAVNFMMPLGLHHIMSANGHYGPGPWWAPKGAHPEQGRPYYHRAGKDGIGFDRTTKGSGAVSQYHEPLASRLNSAETCPEIYLLWFHHLPWDYKMKNGKTLWEAICYHYDKGVKQVRSFQKTWNSVQRFVDEQPFREVAKKLQEQHENAVLWKDGCIQYFQQYSHLPVPQGVAAAVYPLDSIIAGEFKHKVK